ncbi:homeobox-leucine zipper protein ATHB-12-like [Humulus lupulus]|uniref:homeobox-leucine zipper protein ATHB-12-like n=1 Tax=Humulus lupulus TaxID=3486 RepID=UPI002B417028|nr:homeobox-leucine zipper protein ATHB-12-like [Humulus lupulus]
MKNTMTCRENNKKRFSDEQLKSLEGMFQSDSRPESRAKQKLAGELGLQPRQVAIWFQNRRARSRTKQIEREYNILKGSYSNLVSSFESLKRENQELNNQLQEVTTLLGKDEGSGELESDHTEKGIEASFESKDLKSFKKIVEVHHGDDSNSRDVESVGKETEVLDLASSIDDWSCFESGHYVDEPNCSSWWEFWS